MTLHKKWSFLLRISSENVTKSAKMNFSIKDFFSKWDQIRRKLRIWSHLLQKSIMENFIFCVVLRLKFSHLNEHKYHHKSNDCVSPMCKFGAEIETAKHLFLASLIPCQWKTKYPWQSLSDRSFNYKSWWRIFNKYCIQGCRERRVGGSWKHESWKHKIFCE